MRSQTSFEWDIETWDIDDSGEDVDCLDHEFNKLALMDLNSVNGSTRKLVLVRNVGNEIEGIVKRTWAYAFKQNGTWKLPQSFENGLSVPMRFHEQLSKKQG